MSFGFGLCFFNFNFNFNFKLERERERKRERDQGKGAEEESERILRRNPQPWDRDLSRNREWDPQLTEPPRRPLWFFLNTNLRSTLH